MSTPTNLPRTPKTLPIQPNTAQSHLSSSKGNNILLHSIKVMSNTDIDKKKAKDLCLWCEDKFVFCHKCNQDKLLLIEIVEKDIPNETTTNVELEQESPQM